MSASQSDLDWPRLPGVSGQFPVAGRRVRHAVMLHCVSGILLCPSLSLSYYPPSSSDRFGSRAQLPDGVMTHQTSDTTLLIVIRHVAFGTDVPVSSNPRAVL